METGRRISERTIAGWRGSADCAHLEGSSELAAALGMRIVSVFTLGIGMMRDQAEGRMRIAARENIP